MAAALFQVKLWLDEWFHGLSSEEKLLWVYLLTGEHAYGGRFHLPVKTAAFESGVSADKAADILGRFERAGKIARNGDEITLITTHERCARCGMQHDLTRDHITPRSKGGEDTEDNYQWLCRKCNSTKGNRHATRY